ncbi:MAG: hypothetical protein AAGL49_04750 [Pseudomonadota bacterium]
MAASVLAVAGPAAAEDGEGFGSSIFPLFGDRFRAAGHDLPRPFGLGGVLQLNGRDFAVDDVQLEFANGSTLNVDDVITVDTVAATDNRMFGFVADVWILPFFNVYFVAGDGRSESDVDIEVDIDLPFIPNALVTADVDVDGRVLGGGGILAGQYRDFFYSVGVNYISTSSDSIDGDYEYYTITPRVGYRILQRPNLGARAWIGATYFDAEKNVSGLIDLPIVEPVRYSFELKPLTNWEASIGASLLIADHWQSILELSSDFEDATSLTLNVGYRL